MRRDEQGFTLVELLVAMTIGTVVLFAAFGLVDLAVSSQVETENRLEAAQRGRSAMEDVSRRLRSQLCPPQNAVDPVPPIELAENDRVKFYSSLVSAQSGSVALQKRVIAYEPIAGTQRGRLVERLYLNKGTATEPVWNDTPANDAPDATRTITDNVAPVDATTPIFRYYRYDPSVAEGEAAKLLPLTPPLTATQQNLVVQVRVAFAAYSTGARKADVVRTALDSRVFVRTANPIDPSFGARCIA